MCNWSTSRPAKRLESGISSDETRHARICPAAVDPAPADRYEEGNYAQAQRTLQSALVNGLASRTDQARAYKYLAFIYCVTERVPQCRQEFSNAITADPKFTLTAAEAGHPTWGPVYRSVRGR